MTTLQPAGSRLALGRTRSRPSLAPNLAIAVTVLLWASAFVAIRHVGRQVAPGPLTLGRCAVASLALGLLLLARHSTGRAAFRRPGRRDWPALLGCGVLWFGVYNVALNAAERRVDAGTAAMLVNVGPLVIALLAGLLLGEGFPRRLVLGSLVAFAGVVLIAVAFTTWAYALARTSAGRLGSTTYLVPPITIALGWGLLGEVPPVLAVLGGAVCLGGVAVSRGLGGRR
jgi:drug/metabolite transporter (DMT)-like permease